MTEEKQTSSPFHGGEAWMQAQVGAAQRLARVGGRVIRPYMPEQHRLFFTQQPFLVAGAVDPEGQAWATLLTGPPGFVASPDDRTLELRVSAAAQDPATRGLRGQASVGLLGIEPQTRRRNRVNGTLRCEPWGFSLSVQHSFGNCPKYIQRRALRRAQGAPPAQGAQRSNALTDRARAMIEAADTFYVASYVDLEGQARQVDVSHRGGKPGFVHVDAQGVLTVPDFAGNLFFNTLGNFILNPRAGLLFVDFETGDLLQMTGAVRVLLDDPRVHLFEGAQRLWVFTPQELVWRPGASGLRWELVEPSPYNQHTGSW